MPEDALVHTRSVLKKGFFTLKDHREYLFIYEVIGSKNDKNYFKPLSWTYFVKKGKSICNIWQFHKFSDYLIDSLATK